MSANQVGNLMEPLKLNNFIFPFKIKTNCSAVGCVYIIQCKKCNHFYIGEISKTVKTRIQQHIRDIKFFKNNINQSLSNFNSKSPVAIHFALNNHNLEKDFCFFVYNENLLEDKTRKSIEADLIHIFKKLEINILNKDIPNTKIVSKLSFQT